MQPVSGKPSTGRELDGRLKLCLWASVLVLGTAGMANDIADTDLWGHVQYGREVLADWKLPQTSTWTFAAPNTPWINHENLAELWLALAYDGWGISGLVLSKLTISLVIIALMIGAGRSAGANWLAIAFSVFIASDLMYMHWHYRPQVLTYLAFAVLLGSWQFVFRDWSTILAGDTDPCRNWRKRLNFLLVLPLLFCFWANAHGGFAAGLVVAAVYLGCRGLEWVWHSRRIVSYETGLMGGVLVSCFAATLWNPYGLDLWRFMGMALTLPRTEIIDFQPLDWRSGEALMVLLAVLPFGGAWLIDRRRCDRTQMLLLALILWQGLSHVRHLVIFAVMVGFWLPAHLQVVLDWAWKQLDVQNRNWLRKRSVSWMMASGLAFCALLSLAPKLPTFGVIRVERNFYPVAALQFMEQHGLKGKTVASFNWGQYVLGYFAQRGHGTVAIDGRYETCYPRPIIDLYFDFLLGPPDPDERYRSPHTPPYDPEFALLHGDPDLVLIEARSAGEVHLQQKSDEWVQLYRDSVAQLWGKRKRFDQPESPDYLPPEHRLVSEQPQQGFVAWPAFPEAGCFVPTPPQKLARISDSQ